MYFNSLVKEKNVKHIGQHENKGVNSKIQKIQTQEKQI